MDATLRNEIIAAARHSTTAPTNTMATKTAAG